MSSDSTPHARIGANRHRFYPLVIASLAVVAYSGGIRGDFVYDDPTLIRDNPWVTEPGHLWDILSRPLFGHVSGTTSSHSYYRPVPLLVFRGLYALFGATPAAFHGLSILLHIAASLLVWRFVRFAFGARAHAAEGAMVAAALFAVHPGPSEAVAWISGMMDLFAVTWGLLALVIVCGRETTWRSALAGVLWFIALLSKEVALVVPGILLVFDLFVRPESQRPRNLVWWIGRYLPFAVALVAYFALRYSVMPLRATGAHAALTATEIVASAFALLFRYVALLAWPGTLNVVHPFTPTHSLLAPEALLGAACVAALGALAWYGRRGPHGLGASWFLLSLAPALYVPMLGESAFAERYAYLATAGAALLVASGGLWLFRFAEGGAARIAVGAAVAAIIVTAMGRTMVRIPAWSDELTLWSEAARISPDEFVPRYNLGAELLRRRDPEGALPHLQKAFTLRPDYAPGLSHLGIAYAMTGRNSEAIEVLTSAARRSPRDTNILHNLGLAQRRAGRIEEAIATFERALALNPSRNDSRAALERLRHSTEQREAGNQGRP